MKDYERKIDHYQSILESKDALIGELKQKYDEQTNYLQAIVCHDLHFYISLILFFQQEQHLFHSNEQSAQIRSLQTEVYKVIK